MAARCGIYEIRRVGTDEVYVGQSIDIDRRISNHLGNLKANRHRSPRLQNSYNKHGSAAFAATTLADGFDPQDKEILTLAEQEFMDAANSVFNSAPVAGSMAGFKHSAEFREKARLARLGKTSPWKGCSPSEETRKKMSAAKIGKPSSFKGKTFSPEAIAKMSVDRKGRPSPKRGTRRPAEANAKQSAAMKGRVPWNKGVPCSDEAKQKSSLAQMGRPWSPQRRAACRREQPE